MKVTTVPSPIDTILGSHSASPGRRGGFETSFPETLRGVRAEREEPQRGSGEEARPVKSSRDGDEAESVRESAAGQEDAATQSAEDSPIDGVSETTDVDPVPAIVIMASAKSTDGSAATQVVTSPAVVEASPTSTADAPVPAGTESAATGAAPSDGTVATKAPSTGAVDEAAVQREPIGSAARAGPQVVEGETTAVGARGATPPTETPTPPLVQPESRPSGATKAPGEGWFHASERAQAVAGDRAAFHLLEGTGSPDENRAVSPVVSVGAPPGRPTVSSGSESAPETIAPPVGGTAVRVEGSSPSTVTAAEVVPADGEPAALARRIYRLVRRAVARGDHELRVRLDPPRLGRVDVDLSVERDRIGIRFTVDTAEVRDALRSHLAELHDSLGEHGFSAGSVEIDLRQDGADTGGHRDGRRSGTAVDVAGEGAEPDLAEIRLWHLGRAVDLRG